jgi:hypothetical protein
MNDLTLARLTPLLESGIDCRLQLSGPSFRRSLQLWVQTDREASTWSVEIGHGRSFHDGINLLFDAALDHIILEHPSIADDVVCKR